MGASILVTSAVAPPITIDLGAAASGGQPSLVLRILKPRVQVLGPADGAPPLFDEAPAGDPGDTWPLYTFGAAMVAVAILALAIRGALK